MFPVTSRLLALFTTVAVRPFGAAFLSCEYVSMLGSRHIMHLGVSNSRFTIILDPEFLARLLLKDSKVHLIFFQREMWS